MSAGMAGASIAGANALNAQADQVMRQAQLDPSSKSDAKIEKSARDFEAILLTNWLQQAEESFATVPGTDDDDSDPGKGEFQGMAMQSLAGSIADSGGIGIARMIAKQLHATVDKQALEVKEKKGT